jgi:hypothetical protein
MQPQRAPRQLRCDFPLSAFRAKVDALVPRLTAEDRVGLVLSAEERAKRWSLHLTLAGRVSVRECAYVPVPTWLRNRASELRAIGWLPRRRILRTTAAACVAEQLEAWRASVEQPAFSSFVVFESTLRGHEPSAVASAWRRFATTRDGVLAFLAVESFELASRSSTGAYRQILDDEDSPGVPTSARRRAQRYRRELDRAGPAGGPPRPRFVLADDGTVRVHVPASR